MKNLRYVMLIVFAVLLVAGCSEDRKKEAAKLEKELEQRQGEVAESTQVPPPDTMAQHQAQMQAEAVPAEPEVGTPAPGQTSGYSVQVASCESRKYAESLVEKYKKRGFDPYITEFDYNGQVYYRVRLGPYDSRAAAESAKMELKDRYSINAWVDYTA